MSETTTIAGQGTLVDLAVRALRSELRAGHFAPGSRIHLSEAAARLGMSAIPVREALRTLATEGLVVSLPHRGFRVPETTLADLEDTYSLRLVLDPIAVERAVPNMDDARIAGAEEALADLAESLGRDDWEGARLGNRRFHFAIYDAAESPWLLRLISMLWENSERYQRLAARHRGSPEDRAAEHRGILDACEAGNARGAATAMYEHLDRTYQVARLHLGDSG